ncbi:MAG: hypothetical protein OXF75_07720 [Acidimicrobiaceae bacterium]|nr:hypothetical protein [Acidimicrobiaceae bacterium]
MVLQIGRPRPQVGERDVALAVEDPVLFEFPWLCEEVDDRARSRLEGRVP